MLSGSSSDQGEEPGTHAAPRPTSGFHDTGWLSVLVMLARKVHCVNCLRMYNSNVNSPGGGCRHCLLLLLLPLAGWFGGLSTERLGVDEHFYKVVSPCPPAPNRAGLRQSSQEGLPVLCLCIHQALSGHWLGHAGPGRGLGEIDQRCCFPGRQQCPRRPSHPARPAPPTLPPPPHTGEIAR